MTQYEYKVVKSRVIDQEYYTSWLSAFGWQVQNIQEFVDQVVNQSLGFSYNTGNTNMFGRAYSPYHSRNTYFSGNQYSHGWGSQSNTSVTNVKTKLSITFFRDVEFPGRSELNEVESRWWNASKRYLDKVIDLGVSNKQWPEFKQLQSIESEAYAIRRRTKQAAQKISTPVVKTPPAAQKPVQVENKPIQVPNTPATATINGMEVTHNVFQSGLPGIQIRLSFSIQHRKGYSCGVLAYFRDENGVGLTDLNHKFQTSTGRVCVGSSCKPDFEDALFNDYLLFMPYEELDQPDGSRKLQFNVQIYDDAGKKFIAQSEHAFFTFTKSGTTMRGEALSTVPVAQPVKPKVEPIKPPAIKKPAASPKPSITPVKTPPPQTPEQRKEGFRERTGWEGQSENRKLFLDGVHLDFEGKHSQALKTYQKVLKLEPLNVEYIIVVSNSYFAQGNNAESLQVLEDGLGKIPGSPALLHWQAMTLIRMKDFPKAEKSIEQLKNSKENNAEYFSYSAQAYLAETRGDYQAAIRFYDLADAKSENPDKNPLKGLGQQRCRERLKNKG